jgi:hypothetical protein
MINQKFDRNQTLATQHAGLFALRAVQFCRGWTGSDIFTPRTLMMRDFIAGQNVDRYLSMLLGSDFEPARQKTLQRLLVEEEDQLSRSREQLELAERRLHDGKVRVARVRKIAKDMRADEPPRERALSLLATMETTLELLEQFNRMLRNDLYPYCIMLQTTLVGVCTTLDQAEQRARQFANANPGLSVLIIDRSNGDSRVVEPE